MEHKFAERVYKLASAILASKNTTPQAAITIALWFIELLAEIERSSMTKRKQVSIVDAIRDKRLFGSLFPDFTSWSAWLVFLKATFVIPMDKQELELYRGCTRRNDPPTSVKEAYAIVGRRGGKSRIVSFAAVYLACFHSFQKYLAPGEVGLVLCLARDRHQAKVVFNYIVGVFRSVAALNQMVTAYRSDEIELTNGINILVKTSDYRAIRGPTVVCCIADEVAFWDSQGVSPDKEIFAALRPSMATIPEAKLLVISSPYAKAGVLFDQLLRDGAIHHPGLGLPDQDVTVSLPEVPLVHFDEEIERDPDAARSEWFAQFREDVEAAFSLESIEQCVIPGRSDLLPAQAIHYRAFVDPSGGRRDQFTVAIAHRKSESAIIDLVRAWPPPFDPSQVAKECSEALKPYRIKSVIGDNYGGEWAKEQFRKHGINYELSEKHRSQLYLDLIPALNSKRVELPDNRKLIDELRRLERRRGRSGKDSIDHPAYGGSDDIANSVAGAVDLVISKPVMSVNAMPTGVGRNASWPFASTLGQRLPGSVFGGSDDDDYYVGAKPIR